MTSGVHERLLLKSVGVAFHIDPCADGPESWMTVRGLCNSHIALQVDQTAREPELNSLLSLQLACPGIHSGWGIVLNVCQVFIYRYHLCGVL